MGRLWDSFFLTLGPFSPEEQDLLYSLMQVHADTSPACSLVSRLSLLSRNHTSSQTRHSHHALLSCSSIPDKHWNGVKTEASKNWLYSTEVTTQHNNIEFLHVIVMYYVFTWENTTGISCTSAKRNTETVLYQFLDTCDNRTPVYTYQKCYVHYSNRAGG